MAALDVLTPSVPLAYREPSSRVSGPEAALAGRYVAHTTLGDPLADAMVEALAHQPLGQGAAWIEAAMERGPGAIADAPEPVRAFFAEAEQVPRWFEPAAVLPGCRAFHRHSEMFIGAFVAAVLIEGFVTLISQSFSITGRMAEKGVRRLKQNNRHLVEIFMPGGLERHGDGWKLSVRIRLVHAQVRRLLNHAEDWNAEAWGAPLSAAHIGFAGAAFSGLLLERAAMLGVELTPDEEASFMMVWRYAGHLMGVVPELQCATRADALELVRVGRLCEPPPEFESVILANGLINSAPIVAGVTDAAERAKLVRRIYRIARALIGDELADALRFPPMRTTGTLGAIRLKNRLESFLHRHAPRLVAGRLRGQFHTLLDVSHYAEEGIRYQLPWHLRAEKDTHL